jgi:hypothetical protein
MDPPSNNTYPRGRARRGYNSNTNDNASDGNRIHRNGEVEMGIGTCRDVFVTSLRKQ